MKKSELVSFDIEGAEMTVRLAGDREKPALLLIHGLPNSSAHFRNVIGLLARDCFVIAPDLPGFGGFAPVNTPYSRVGRHKHRSGCDRLGVRAPKRRIVKLGVIFDPNSTDAPERIR
jgi:hypothetical protein